jgi:hypothetical protein
VPVIPRNAALALATVVAKVNEPTQKFEIFMITPRMKSACAPQ